METNSECPACFHEWKHEENVIEGEVITCPDCGKDLEVTSVDKNIKFAILEASKEDWGE